MLIAERYIQMVGTNRSIFALVGLKHLVYIIDDPAYRLEEEVFATPHGYSAEVFLLDRYVSDSKVPFYVAVGGLDAVVAGADIVGVVQMPPDV